MVALNVPTVSPRTVDDATNEFVEVAFVLVALNTVRELAKKPDNTLSHETLDEAAVVVENDEVPVTERMPLSDNDGTVSDPALSV